MFAGVLVVGLGVVGGVGQEGVDGGVAGRVGGGGPQVRGVLTRPAGDADGDEQVGSDVEGDGQFRPAFLAFPAAGAEDEVAADGPALIAGGVDGHAELAGRPATRSGERGGQECVAPFLVSSRLAARWIVL